MQTLPALVATTLLLIHQAAPLVQSVDLAVPVAPVYFRQAGAVQLVYELHITNFLQTDVTALAPTCSRSPTAP